MSTIDRRQFIRSDLMAGIAASFIRPAEIFASDGPTFSVFSNYGYYRLNDNIKKQLIWLKPAV